MQRIRMKPDATPTPITSKNGVLGVFLPGLGYWITEENAEAVRGVLEAGMAEYEDADKAPFAQIDLRASAGQVSGAFEVEE